MMSIVKPQGVAPFRSPSVLVSGAVLLDILGQYPGDFAGFEWKTVPQSVAFDAMSPLTYLIESYGGCAANIAYNLTGLGVSALLVSAAGSDFDISYRSHLEQAGVDLSAIRVFTGKTRTPRSVTITDRSGRQFTFWAANGMGPADFPSILQHCEQRRPEMVIIASNLPSIMLNHLYEAASCQRPRLWAPGGDIASFEKENLRRAWATSNYIVINESEWEAAKTILGGAPDWPPGLQAVVITRGEKGCAILQKDHRPVGVRAAQPDVMLDPTGCGDAFVSGFAWGLTQGFELRVCAEVGSSLAILNLESLGTQCHRVAITTLRERLQRDYGRDLRA